MGKLWASVGACIRLDRGLYRALWGVLEGFPWASAQIVHQHSKIVSLGYPCAIAFLDCLQKSVLRAFLGGLFGFIGFRCIFGCLVAFVGLVGLYACSVRRLRTWKRKRPYFCGLLRPLFLWASALCICLSCVCCFACLVYFAPVVCGLCCWWFFFPLDDRDKKKGRKGFSLRPLFVCCMLLKFLYSY